MGTFSILALSLVVFLCLGDRLDPKNWRPISLLNVDYNKLAACIIAGRLLKVIHLVVDKDQTCGVPGRYIGENVALFRDVVYFSTSFDIPVAILSLDQEKAFDRVDWDFVRVTLSTMGFGPLFISWVNLFYNRVQSAVNVNGYLSPFSFFLVVFVRAVLYLLCFMFWSRKFLLLIFVVTLAFLVLFIPTYPLCQPSLSTPMTLYSFCHLMTPSKLPLRRTTSMRKLLVSN